MKSLLFAVGLIGLVWMWVLPSIGRTRPMREYRAWLKQNQINPSAMFYTELDVMDPILRRIENRGPAAGQQQGHDALTLATPGVHEATGD